MREVAIVSPVRTAVGSFGGSLKDVSAADLAPQSRRSWRKRAWIPTKLMTSSSAMAIRAVKSRPLAACVP